MSSNWRRELWSTCWSLLKDKYIFLMSYEAALPWTNAFWVKEKGLVTVVFINFDPSHTLDQATSPEKLDLQLLLTWKSLCGNAYTVKIIKATQRCQNFSSPGKCELCLFALPRGVMGQGGQGEHRAQGDFFTRDINKAAALFLRIKPSVFWWVSRWQWHW